MKDFTIYSPLSKEFDYDANIIIKEIMPLLVNEQERTLPFENGRSIYDQSNSLKIASETDLENTTKYKIVDGNRVPVTGKFKTYHVYNLTYLPEEVDSQIDIYRHDDPEKKIFWHTYKKPFTWREELQGTETKRYIEQFPWEYIQGVRVIHMTPPSIGQIHRDSHPIANYKYFKDGFASITFNVAHGGGVLNYIDKDIQHCVDNSVKMFHFNDSALHGVTPITSERIQLRIWGKLKVSYKDLLDVL
jgi:hypothetical protein